MAQRSTFGFLASARSFFMRGTRSLEFCALVGIGGGNFWPRLPKPKVQAPEQSLATAHRNLDVKFRLEPLAQSGAIPKIRLESYGSRRVSQNRIDPLQLRAGQLSWASAPLPFLQARQAAILEPVDPILHSAGRVAQELGHLSATKT